MNLVIQGNTKMGRKVGVFNLPPRRTCCPSEWCLTGRGGNPACYALRNNFLLPSVANAALARLEASKQPDFVGRMVAEIQGNYHYFRVHASGDFYSAKYVRKWIEIAKAVPKTIFRTTTRRRDLTEVLQELNALPNFIVRESLDPEYPTPTMRLPFAALSSMGIAEGTFLCTNDCVKCKYTCWKQRTSMCFDEH